MLKLIALIAITSLSLGAHARVRYVFGNPPSSGGYYYCDEQAEPLNVGESCAQRCQRAGPNTRNLPCRQDGITNGPKKKVLNQDGKAL
jgi:hypothetical protein